MTLWRLRSRASTLPAFAGSVLFGAWKIRATDIPAQDPGISAVIGGRQLFFARHSKKTLFRLKQMPFRTITISKVLQVTSGGPHGQELKQ